MKTLWGKLYSNPHFHCIKILQKNYKAISINYLYMENKTRLSMGTKITYLEILSKTNFKKLLNEY